MIMHIQRMRIYKCNDSSLERDACPQKRTKTLAITTCTVLFFSNSEQETVLGLFENRCLLKRIWYMIKRKLKNIYFVFIAFIRKFLSFGMMLFCVLGSMFNFYFILLVVFLSISLRLQECCVAFVCFLLIVRFSFFYFIAFAKVLRFSFSFRYLRGVHVFYHDFCKTDYLLFRCIYLKRCSLLHKSHQCITVRPSLSVSVHFCTCCTFHRYPKTN